MKKRWSTTQSKLRQIKRYYVEFNYSWCNKFKLIWKSRKGEGFALCTVCRSNFLLHMEEKIIPIDTRTLQRTSFMWIREKDVWMQHNDKENYRFCCKVKDCKLRLKSSESQTAFFCLLVKHNVPLSTAYYAVKLFRKMFPDSKIMNKYRCGRTKTTHMLPGAVV